MIGFCSLRDTEETIEYLRTELIHDKPAEDLVKHARGLTIYLHVDW